MVKKLMKMTTRRTAPVIASLSILMLSAASAFAQEAGVRINLAGNNIGVVDALKEVQKQTGFSIGYNQSQLNRKAPVSLNLKNAELATTLNTILKGTGYTYEISGNYIKIVPATNHTAAVATGEMQTVTGRVVDTTGEPMVGVSVLVKGTQTGVATNIDGTYSIRAPKGSTLVFSYLGCTPREAKVGNSADINIELAENATALDEVVVTALGIKREQKSLSYNVQQINGDLLTENKDANFINSLAGKVAGVNINASSSGVGGISKVVMRGTKSIMQSSNALYVVDGMPMRSSNAQGDTEFGSRGATEPIADLNPDDIESMSVLTGAAAAALYGSEAANGAIVITTKKGQKGKTKLTYSSNLNWDNAFILPRFQSRYGTGAEGKYIADETRSWGRRLGAANSYGYNLADDYLQTGFVSTQAVTFSTGNDKNQTYASVAALNSDGIVPNNGYDRYNFSFRNTTSFLDDAMTLDVNGQYIRQTDRNMINQGVYNNPMVGAVLFPRGNDWNDIQVYERYNPQRKIYTQYWPMGDAGMTIQNPYWINYRNLRENAKDRYILGGQLNYKITPWLSLTGRLRIDNSTNLYTQRYYATTNNQLTGLSDRGYYGAERSENKQTFGDFLLSFNKNFGDNWSVQANFGGSISDMRYDAMLTEGPIADGSATFAGEPVGLTNFFAVQNLSVPHTKNRQNGWHEQTQSLYASADIGYLNTYYLTLTGRNDWPSQLAGPNSQNSSFFYPSAGLSVLLNNILPISPQALQLWKLRGSYASVGTAFNRYIANPRYEFNESTGTWSILTQYPMYDLKPERTNSLELGMNFRFFNDFTFDATYYRADTKNQTFDPGLPVSKYSKIYIQTGCVRNDGMEFSLGYNHSWGNFTWDTGITYSFNRNKIVDLADNAINPETGESIPNEILDMGGLGSTRFLLKKGGSMGDIYSTVDLRRDSNGMIYVDETRAIQTSSIQDKEQYIHLGNVMPKGNLAWNNTLRYRNLSLSALVTARLGGVVFSRTQALLDYFGVSEATGNARDLGYVAINNGDRVNPEIWYTTVAGGTAVPQYYTYSATNVRLQEMNVTYSIPRRWVRNLCDIKVSLIGRNLLMIYNKAPFDPESVASTSNYYQGIDYFMMPSLRSYGFNLNFTF